MTKVSTKPSRKPPENRPFDIAHASQYHHGETSQLHLPAHAGNYVVRQEGHENAGGSGQGARDGEGYDHDAVDVDAQEPGCLLARRYRAYRGAETRPPDEVAEGGHEQDGGDEDQYLRPADAEAAVAADEEGARIEHSVGETPGLERRRRPRRCSRG